MSLILVREIQRVTDFEEDKTSHIVVELKLVNYDKLEEQAKQIDKENYSKDCFGIEYNYVHNEEKLYVLDDGMFYVDNLGNKHFIECGKSNLKIIERCVLMEYKKFLKDKEKYLKNHNMTYDVI